MNNVTFTYFNFLSTDFIFKRVNIFVGEFENIKENTVENHLTTYCSFVVQQILNNISYTEKQRKTVESIVIKCLKQDKIVLNYIEQGLSVQIQRNLVQSLVDCFPSSQFFISTYSDEILRNFIKTKNVDFKEIQFFFEKDGLVFSPSTNPVGLDSNTVKNQCMGLNQTTSETKLVELGQELLTSIKQNNLSEVDVIKEKLLTYTTEDNPIFVRINSLLKK